MTNPRAVMAAWACLFGGGVFGLSNVSDLPDFGAVPVGRKIAVVASLFLLTIWGIGIWFLIRVYRRGQEVAVTTDGLIIRLATFDGKLIPWERVGPASVFSLPKAKTQTARVLLMDKNEHAHIGGLSNVFPTRKAVEQFVTQVNERAKGGDAEPASNDENIPS